MWSRGVDWTLLNCGDDEEGRRAWRTDVIYTSSEPAATLISTSLVIIVLARRDSREATRRLSGPFPASLTSSFSNNCKSQIVRL